MKRFVLGDAGLKLVAFDEAPTVAGARGGPAAGVSGLRYVTVEVSDVAQTVDAAFWQDELFPMPPTKFEQGFLIAIVEDPEGNWVN